MRASEIRELLKLLEQPGITSFAGGIPDPKLFPIAEAQATYADVLGDPTLGRKRYNTRSAKAICHFGNGSCLTWRREACRVPRTTS